MGGERREYKKFQELVKKVRDKEFKYVAKEEKPINWTNYDKAQIHEINDMLLLIADFVDESTRRLGIQRNSEKGPGRPSYPPDDIAKGVLMQQYLCFANRQTEGLIILFKEKMRISTTFSQKTIERSYQDFFVTMILKEVFKMVQEPISEMEHNFSIDGTCLPTSIKQNWENDKRKLMKEKDQKKKDKIAEKEDLKTGKKSDEIKEPGKNETTVKIAEETKKKKSYEKMIAFCGTTYKMITSVTFPDNPHANESPFFVPLLRFTSENYEKIDLVAGDAAYISRLNCNEVAGMGGIPRIFPKEGITLKMRGSAAWTKMLLTLIDDPQKWLEEYHNRSISETVNSTFKRDFPSPLHKKLEVRRKQEAFLRVCDYDLKRLCYLKYIENIDVKVGS